jgi:hypothetical protein
LPTSATVTEQGHTERSTIPRAELAVSTLSSRLEGISREAASGTAPANPCEPTGWHPKVPAAPAVVPRASVRAVAQWPTRSPTRTSCHRQARREVWNDSRESSPSAEARFRPAARTDQIFREPRCLPSPGAVYGGANSRSAATPATTLFRGCRHRRVPSSHEPGSARPCPPKRTRPTRSRLFSLPPAGPPRRASR